MGRKASIQWLTGQLIEILADELRISSQELGVAINQKQLAPAVLSALDELIIFQAHGLGRRILLSPLVFMRYLEWESQDNFDLSRRFHQALEKHWKILHRGATPPMPAGMREFQKEVVAELKLVCKRLHKQYQSVTREPALRDILNAFDQAVADLGCNHLAHPAKSWHRFLTSNWQKSPTPPEAFAALLLSLRTPPQLFREWLSWSWTLKLNTIDYYISHGKIR